MATVETVLGPVDAATLGITLSHEHVLVGMGEDNHHYPWLFDWEQTRTKAIRELSEAKAGGVDTMIDLTTTDLGRDIEFVRDVARASGMNVVAATGIWRDVPRSFWTRDFDRIADIFVWEIEVGIGDTSIKAGAIKVAHDIGGVTAEGERVLRAAARALKRTGCPISTHHWAPEQVGTRQVEILREEGAPMDRVCIGVQRRHDRRRLPGIAAERRRVPFDGPLPGWRRPSKLAPAQRDGQGAQRPRLGASPDARPRPRAGPGHGRLNYSATRGTNTLPLREYGRRPRAPRRRRERGDDRPLLRDVPRRFLTGED